MCFTYSGNLELGDLQQIVTQKAIMPEHNSSSTVVLASVVVQRVRAQNCTDSHSV